MRWRDGLLAMALVLASSGCAAWLHAPPTRPNDYRSYLEAGGGGGGRVPVAPSLHEYVVLLFSDHRGFQPQRMPVLAGSTILFRNMGPQAGVVIQGIDDGWRSPPLGIGDAASVVLKHLGSFRYQVLGAPWYATTLDVGPVHQGPPGTIGP